nr:ribosomal protein L4 [Proteomonas sp. NEIS-1375]
MGTTQTINYKIYQSGEGSTSDISLTLDVKVDKPRYLLHRAVVAYDANRRQGTSSSKTRSEVRGGGKKPWKQKGTGNARSGSSNSPLWRGGGAAFGPKPRSYSKKLNTKEWRLALKTTLNHQASKTVILGNYDSVITTLGTKEALALIKKALGVETLTEKTVLILTDTSTVFARSLQNVACIQLLRSKNLNVKDLLHAKHIVITDTALKDIEEVYSEHSN